MYDQSKMLEWLDSEGLLEDLGIPIPDLAAMSYEEVEAWSKQYRPESIESDSLEDGTTAIFGWRDDVGDIYEVAIFDSQEEAAMFCDKVLGMEMPTQ